MSVISVFRAGKDLIQLVIIIFVIIQVIILFIRWIPVLIIISVAWFMDIPGRQVKTHIQVMLRACFRYFRQNIPLTILIACLSHIISGVITGPDTESVMMLCCYDYLLKSGVFYGCYKFFRVKIISQFKDLVRCFTAVMLTPLNLIKSVGSKMAERCQLVFLIFILIRIRNCSPCRRSFSRVVSKVAVNDITRELSRRMNNSRGNPSDGHSGSHEAGKQK